MKEFKISEEEYQAILKAEKETHDKRQSKKLQILILRYKGKTNTEVAEIMGLSSARIRGIIKEYEAQGLEEFLRCKYGGNHRSMSYEEEEELLAPFRKKAEAGQIVSGQEIKKVFDEKIGKDTGRGYVYMMLARHNWRKVMPRPKHPKKADDEAVNASKKLTNV